jgi:lipid-binding SYLF domain-containing protein
MEFSNEPVLKGKTMNKYVGDVKMNPVSVGLQAGGQAFSQIVFLQDKHSFDEFTSGGMSRSPGR